MDISQGSPLSVEERESIAQWYSRENDATFYTADPAIVRRMDKLCQRDPSRYKCTRRDSYGADYVLPTAAIMPRYVATGLKGNVNALTAYRAAQGGDA